MLAQEALRRQLLDEAHAGTKLSVVLSHGKAACARVLNGSVRMLTNVQPSPPFVALWRSLVGHRQFAD